MPMRSSIARAALCARSLLAGAVAAAGVVAGALFVGATTGLVPEPVAADDELVVNDPGRLTLDAPLLELLFVAVELPAVLVPVVPPFGVTGGGGGATALLVTVMDVVSGLSRSSENGWVVSAGAGVPAPGISSVTTGTIARLN